jgi:queuine/archaeosine tRNA-ribosyltransferase
MKFIFADSLDYVDPGYDFLTDRFSAGRQAYWDDQFPHEILGYAPYDGVLVSRAIVSSPFGSAKYTDSQAMRLRREGARTFLRLNTEPFLKLDLFGDCGAFAYAQHDAPPYTPEDMVSFYEDGRFTHGCSVDHIIFDFDPSAKGPASGSDEARRRSDITLANAAEFKKASQPLGNQFTPLGVVQGWSPWSMAEAAKSLVKMGYSYLALGGMVPLKTPQIKMCLQAIRDAVPASTRIHILGFAKADDIDGFTQFNITSFDTTSPLIRAFKDKKHNYYLPGQGGKLRTFSAIRVPQSLENPRLMKFVKEGKLKAEHLTRLERQALETLRSFDKGKVSMEKALDAVMEYAAPMELGVLRHDAIKSSKSVKALKDIEARYHQTLAETPWKQCACNICKQASIDVVIFRASNRNKRRGIHNLGVFKSHVDSIEERNAQIEGTDEPELFRATG